VPLDPIAIINSAESPAAAVVMNVAKPAGERITSGGRDGPLLDGGQQRVGRIQSTHFDQPIDRFSATADSNWPFAGWRDRQTRLNKHRRPIVVELELGQAKLGS